MSNREVCNDKASPKPKIAPYSDGAQMRDFLKSQIFGTIPPVTASSISSPSLKGRTIIITGANSGLGLEAAKQFAELEHVSRLVLVCRSISKGEIARDEVLRGLTEERKHSLDVVIYELDMAKIASISAFVDRARRELDRVDAVVLNAGVDLASYQKAAEEDGGYEMTLMVNVFGTMMLAVLMVPVLREKKVPAMQAPRITIVGSAVQFMTKYDDLLEATMGQTEESILGWLSNENRWKDKFTQDRYYFSKGLLQMAVRQMAASISEGAQLKDRGMVIVNCVAPGYCRTELFRTAATRGSTLALKLIGRDGHVGARALVVGAIGQEGGQHSHGGYMSEGQVKKCSSWFETQQGHQVAERVWKELLQEIKKSAPGAGQGI